MKIEKRDRVRDRKGEIETLTESEIEGKRYRERVGENYI